MNGFRSSPITSRYALTVLYNKGKKKDGKTHDVNLNARLSEWISNNVHGIAWVYIIGKQDQAKSKLMAGREEDFHIVVTYVDRPSSQWRSSGQILSEVF